MQMLKVLSRELWYYMQNKVLEIVFNIRIVK